MSNPSFSRSDPLPTKSGLTKALDKLGRNRGSSATPAPSIVSPTPRRGIEKQVARMSDLAANGGAGGPPTGRPISTSSPGLNQDTLKSMTDFAKELQVRLFELKRSIRETKGIEPYAVEQLENIVTNLGRDFHSKHRRYHEDFTGTMAEIANLQAKLDRSESCLRASKLNRDQLFSQITELKLNGQDDGERIHDATLKLMAENKELLQQIDFQEQQLRNYRAQHPGSSARRSVTNSDYRDPFKSPSTPRGASQKGKGKYKANYGMMGPGLSGTPAASMARSVKAGDSFGKLNPASANASFNTSFTASFDPVQSPFANYSSPRGQLPVGAPRLRRRGALPTSDHPSNQFTNEQPTKESILRDLENLPKGTGPPSPEARMKHKQSNGHLNGPDPGPKYEADYTVIYSMAEDWAKKFASIPNLESDMLIEQADETLWAFMMNCTYPGHRQDAQAHVKALLLEPKSRYLFVMRLIVSYCIKSIMTADEFSNYSPDVAVTLDQCKKSLQERGLANEVRQSIIDRQTNTIEAITKQDGFEKFRQERIQHHVVTLRGIVGRLLNPHIERNDAGTDLGALVIRAWNATLALHTSSLTFQVYFPETTGKFNAANMVARDQQGVEGMQLQLAQIRLKLVITPVVTMRDDRGTAIRVKNLHKAFVLTMA